MPVCLPETLDDLDLRKDYTAWCGPPSSSQPLFWKCCISRFLHSPRGSSLHGLFDLLHVLQAPVRLWHQAGAVLNSLGLHITSPGRMMHTMDSRHRTWPRVGVWVMYVSQDAPGGLVFFLSSWAFCGQTKPSWFLSLMALCLCLGFPWLKCGLSSVLSVLTSWSTNWSPMGGLCLLNK